MTPEQFIDISLLKIFMDREVYGKYIKFVKIDILDSEIKTILSDFGEYFDAFDKDKIDLEDFPTWFHHYKHPDLVESKHKIYKLIFNRLLSVKTEAAEQVLQKMQQLACSDKIRQSLDKAFSVDMVREILLDYEKSASLLSETDDEDVVFNDLGKILAKLDTSSGLNWRLKCLNDSIGPLNRGVLVVVAAYVDVGKTAFAISESTFMARQLKEGCVLWLNNEEDDNRVYKKIWKSVLACGDGGLEKHSQNAIDEYKRRMHGDLERIKFVNIRKKSFSQLVSLFERYKPRLCVIDQVDKISTSKNKFFSDHDRLKSLYGEVRALANEYCPIIAVSQADVTTVKLNKDTGDIEYQLYPHHRQLDGSKVGKPGEADAIIMIGRRADYPGTRGVHVSKNKFGNSKKQEVIFDGEKVRYENP